MLEYLDPNIYILLAAFGAATSAYITIRFLRQKSHYLMMYGFTAGFIVCTLAIVRKTIEAYLINFKSYLKLVLNIQLVFSAIALILLFTGAYVYGDEKNKRDVRRAVILIFVLAAMVYLLIRILR